MSEVIDKAGEKYWTKVWENTVLPASINPVSPNLGNHINTVFHKVFKSFFKDKNTKDKLFLEVGCGNSVWLPYFAKEHGFQVSGLDYSEYGCNTSRKILEREGVNGDIFCGDLFNPPEHLLNKFDYVISMGVVEHFTDTAATLKALSKLINDDGFVITTIPNHSALLGWLQKILNRPVYDIHVILDKNQLNKAAKQADLNVVFSDYLVSTSLFVNLEYKDKPLRLLPLRKLVSKFLMIITFTIWKTEKIFGNLKGTKFFSPAIISIAQKKNV